jgi:hypothetical protein
MINTKLNQVISIVLLTLSLFSLWALFAVIIVNHQLHDDLPGYTIGELCRWDLLALVIAGALAFLMVKLWGPIQSETVEEKTSFVIPFQLGIYWLSYFILVLVIGAWQWLLFSQSFS